MVCSVRFTAASTHTEAEPWGRAADGWQPFLPVGLTLYSATVRRHGSGTFSPTSLGRSKSVGRLLAGSSHGAILLRQAQLLPDEVEVVDGIPVTSLFRTIFDLAAVASHREVERAFHETEAKQMASRVSLREVLRRHPGRRGAATVRAILASREPAGITESDLEELFVQFLDRYGFPRQRLNATLPARGRLLRPDCMGRSSGSWSSSTGAGRTARCRRSMATAGAIASSWSRVGARLV